MSDSTNDDYDNDTHEQLLKEFWLYCYWQERFERFGYTLNARYARNSLRRIRELAYSRYKEIQAKKKIVAQNRGKKSKDKDI